MYNAVINRIGSLDSVVIPGVTLYEIASSGVTVVSKENGIECITYVPIQLISSAYIVKEQSSGNTKA